MYSNSDVIINNGRHIDTSQNEPDQNLDTMLRVLEVSYIFVSGSIIWELTSCEIDNDAVRNCLIINQAIDQTVLIPDRETANQFAQTNPRNVRATVTHHESKRGQGIRYQVTRSGGISLGPVYAWTGQMRMKTSLEAQLK